MLLSRTLMLMLSLTLLPSCGSDPPVEAPTPAPVPEPTPEPTPPPPPWTTSEVTVQSGQVITKILQDQGLDYGDALALVNAAAPIHDLAKIRAGESLTVRSDRSSGVLLGLVYPLDRFGERRLVVSREDERWSAEEEVRATQTAVIPLAGRVTSSLWGACERLGMSAENIVDLASIFEWEIDFNTQIRKGDSFRLLLEDILDSATKEHLRYGRILAAEFTSSGSPFVGYRYEGADENVGYFNRDGLSSKKMFLKSPLKFSRISSGFTKRRYHPVLKKWRAHNGIDYAAGKGTPVRAIGRGTVTIAGTKGGYGKHVRLKHSNKYGSSYSHLSRIAVRRGQVVDQGQLVGYVGSTGLATGPHLHFEFTVRGTYTNFRAQKFPRTEPISDSERPAFEAMRDDLAPRLEAIPIPDLPTESPQPEQDPGEELAQP